MERIATGIHGYPLITCVGNHAKLQVFPTADLASLASSKSSSSKKSNNEDDKMAKLIRERSTAQKRRQSKREELTKLGATIHELESKLGKLRSRLDSLTEAERQQVSAMQARAGTPPMGCRLCSVLDRREEFSTVDRLVHHFRVHHASELRTRGDDFVLQDYATEIPSEEAAEASDNDDDSDNEDDAEELVKSSSTDSISEMKRKLRLKRNAASARKSRKRKRVQLERWRMILPMLRFEAETLEAAFNQLANASPHSVSQFDAEPDVISAALALIGCSLSAPRIAT
jgi:chromosome segregation ATPase